MKDRSRLHILLSPERFKAMEPVLEQSEIVIEGFQLMKKDYAGVKSKIKSIEKKLAVVMQQAGDDAFICKWIEHEVCRIERKYGDIEHAILHYHRAIKMFNHTLSDPRLFSFNPHETYGSYTGHLRNYLSSAESNINRALDAIRITERYFKNISTAFKSHASLMAFRKQQEHRQWLNEKKLMSTPVLRESVALASEHMRLVPMQSVNLFSEND